MADFKKSRGFNGGARSQGFRPGGGGRPQSGGRGGFDGARGGRDGGRPQMHDATCNECGNRCQVPFRPTGERPVYCSDCFGGKQDAPRREFSRREDTRGSDTRSASARPERTPDTRIDDLAHQISALHKKVDALTELVKTAPVSESAAVSVAKPAPAPARVAAPKKVAAKKPAPAKAAPKKTAKKVATKSKTTAKKKTAKKK